MTEFIQQINEDFPGLFFIQGRANATYPYSNSILCGEYLIDTGISPRLIKKLRKEHEVSRVILSHWHEDHISGNYLFKDSEVDFMAHIRDIPIIEDIYKMNEYYGVENTQIGEDFLKLMEAYNLISVKVGAIIEENQILEINDDLKLKILHTPGHTAGHLCFYEMNTKFAFFADYDLTRFPYYGNIDANLLDFEKSLILLKSLNAEKVAGGHRGLIEGKSVINEEIDRYLNIIEKRDERILKFIPEQTTPIKPEDLKNKNLIYRRYSDYEEFELLSEVLMITKHFEKFLVKKLIIPENDGFILN